MGRTVRRNLAGKLASGVIKPRPGSSAHPRSEPLDPHVMETPEAVERVAMLTAGGMNFYEAFRQVMRELDPPRNDQ